MTQTSSPSNPQSAMSPAPSLAPPPRFKPTGTGMFYLALMLFMGMAALNSQANLLFGVFGLMIGLLLVGSRITRAMLRRLDVDRVLPETSTVGEPTMITYRLTNRKRFMPSMAVTLTELDGGEAFTRPPVAFVLHASPRRAASVTIEAMPKRRGLHELDRYALGTSAPFGFVRRGIVARRHDTILVFPAIGEVSPELLARCRSAETTGTNMRPREGGMDEFYGVRDYRAGDNPRSIYWRRSARTGTLVAKQMTQVAPPRLLVMVDTHNPDQTAEQYIAVERAIAQAASLISHGLEAGLSVGLAAWGGTGGGGGYWILVHPNRGKRHRRDLLAGLARLPLNTTQPAGELIGAARILLKTGTTPVLLTGAHVESGWTEDQRTGLLTIGATSAQADAWFRFPESVDFTRCMPIFRRDTAAQAQRPGRPAATAATAPAGQVPGGAGIGAGARSPQETYT